MRRNAPLVSCRLVEERRKCFSAGRGNDFSNEKKKGLHPSLKGPKSGPNRQVKSINDFAAWATQNQIIYGTNLTLR